MSEFYSDDRSRLFHGEALEVLRELPDGTGSIMLTDPPYSSGGFTRGDRAIKTSAKYQSSGTKKTYTDFTGDSRDQRSFITWCSLWMNEARRVIAPGGILATFVDWRQLPSMVDAIQCGGWVYRGIVVWQKPSARPVLGRWRNQCEFVIWGTNGRRPVEGGAYPGFFTHNVSRDKKHLTEKPVPLLVDLLGIEKENPDACVIDPFAGSGTSLKAASILGMKSIGIEMLQENCEIAVERLRSE